MIPTSGGVFRRPGDRRPGFGRGRKPGLHLKVCGHDPDHPGSASFQLERLPDGSLRRTEVPFREAVTEHDHIVTPGAALLPGKRAAGKGLGANHLKELGIGDGAAHHLWFAAPAQSETPGPDDGDGFENGVLFLPVKVIGCRHSELFQAQGMPPPVGYGGR